MDHLTDTFISALRQLEELDDVETIVSLFSNKATLLNPTSKYDSASAFWTSYRGMFDKVRSAFVGVATADSVAFLEWESEGEIEGNAVFYEGVSVIEFADGKITAFRAYFDPSKLSTTLLLSADIEQKDADAANSARDAAADRAGGGYD